MAFARFSFGNRRHKAPPMRSTARIVDFENKRFVNDVKAFAERHLFEKLNEAGDNEENPHIAIFALMGVSGRVMGKRR